MPVDALKALGRRFFQSQDDRRGGPDPALCDLAYRSRIGGYPAMEYEGHHGFATAFYAGFPNLAHFIDDVVAEDGRVVVRFTLRGTHTGNYMGIPASGRSIEVGALALLTVEQGKVIALNAYFDELGMMRQIGAVA